jgi:dTMP kinase
MFAARREHIVQIIEPALARGAYVISDRFADASFAYQCGGRGVDFEKMGRLEQWVQGELQPDLTLLFDVPVDVSLGRLAKARSPDKFEQEGAAFFTRIREAYLRRAEQYPHRFRIIDSDQLLEDVVSSLEKILSTI